LFKLPFEIKESNDVPRFGTVNIIFDPLFLIMTTACIEDKNIVWTFNSLQAGNTQVLVMTSAA